MYKDVFKIRIMARRKELDLTQNQVSSDTEINQTNISKYESGKLEPSLETLGKLAEYYQVSIDWLLGNQYNPNEGDVIKTAINEFYKEVIETITGTAEQTEIREEALDLMLYNLEKDRNKIIEKFTLNN